jgi:hypothetical protein
MEHVFKTYDLSTFKSRTKDGMVDIFLKLNKDYAELYSFHLELKKSIQEKQNQPVVKETNKNNGGTSMFNMNNLFGEFGKIENGSVALTFSGQIAVRRNDNEYVRYNKETQTMENQMDMVLKEASDLIFILPINSVEVDDIIKHKETYYQILEIMNNGGLKAVNIKDGSKKTIIKETNIMGISFYYKVISLFSQGDMDNSTTSGIDPTLLMMLSSGDENNNDDLLPLLLMGNMGNQGGNTGGINPMMLMMMSKDKDKGKNSKMKDLLVMQMIAKQGQTQGNSQSIDPMMLMMMSDGEMDIKTLMLMNMLNKNNQPIDSNK